MLDDSILFRQPLRGAINHLDRISAGFDERGNRLNDFGLCHFFFGSAKLDECIRLLNALLDTR